MTDDLIAEANEFLTLDSVANSPSVGDLIHRLVARVEASQLAWTDAKPAVPGWYWWRAPYSRPEMVHLFNVSDCPPMLVMDRRNGTYMPPDVGQFAGPIPHPADARKGDEK